MYTFSNSYTATPQRLPAMHSTPASFELYPQSEEEDVGQSRSLCSTPVHTTCVNTEGPVPCPNSPLTLATAPIISCFFELAHVKGLIYRKNPSPLPPPPPPPRPLTMELYAGSSHNNKTVLSSILQQNFW